MISISPARSLRSSLLVASVWLAGAAPMGADGAPPDPAAPSPVGEAVCRGCHVVEAQHWDQTLHARVFLTNPRDDLQARACESCHGPGSNHVNAPTNRLGIVAFTRESGVSVEEQNRMCLKCHSAGSRIHWLGSAHELQDIGCSDCHNPMAKTSSQGLLRGESVNQTCFSCHPQQRVEFRKRSHMPLLEGKVSCVGCHEPHGSNTDPLIRADSVNDSCYLCHAEKRGPFIWEHAPVRDSCLNCHRPHGSNHDKLLVSTPPFLCQECHSQIAFMTDSHPNDLLTPGNLPRGRRPDERIVNRACLNCHSRIHGSNHPSGARFHR